MTCGLALDREFKAACRVLQLQGGGADLPGGTPPVHAEKGAHRLECQARNAEPYTSVIVRDINPFHMA